MAAANAAKIALTHRRAVDLLVCAAMRTSILAIGCWRQKIVTTEDARWAASDHRAPRDH